MNNIYEVVNSIDEVINRIVLEPQHNWTAPVGCTIRPYVPEEIDEPVYQLPLTQLEFLRRFTADERVVIRSSTNPNIIDFLHLLTLAQDVKLDDPDTIAGVNYLESINLLAAGRAAEILA